MVQQSHPFVFVRGTATQEADTYIKGERVSGDCHLAMVVDFTSSSSVDLACSVYGSPLVDNLLPPLLIVPGLNIMRSRWDAYARHLHQYLGCVVYVPEYRNIGESPSADSSSFEEVAGDIAALIERKCLESGYDKINILAHSYGGTVLVYVLQNLNSAKRIHQIIFEDFAPCRRFQHRCCAIFGQQFLKEFDQFSEIDLNRPKDVITAEILSLFQSNVRQAMFYCTFIKENPDGGCSWLMDVKKVAKNMKTLRGFPLPKQPDSFNGRVLIIYSHPAAFVTEEDAVETQKYFSNVKFVGLKDCGHEIHRDQPEAFSKILKYFLI